MSSAVSCRGSTSNMLLPTLFRARAFAAPPLPPGSKFSFTPPSLELLADDSNMPALPPLFSATHRHLYPYEIQPTRVCVSDHPTSLLLTSLPPTLLSQSCPSCYPHPCAFADCLLPPEPASLLPSLPSCHRVPSLPARCHFSPVRVKVSSVSFFTLLLQTDNFGNK